jgi:hypothetical protein
MKIKNVFEIINEERKRKPWTANQYKRRWNKEIGLWTYEHREKMGLTNKDIDKVVHHKNGDIHDNRKSNLEVVDRKTHAAIGKPALKHEKCRYCDKPHFARGLCRSHYYKKFKK